MADVKVTLPRDDYNPNQRTSIDVEVVNPDGSTSTRTVKGAVQSTTEEDGTVTFGIMASAHVPFGGGSAYENEVLADSPLLYWRLGDSSGTTATDASGNARHGTYINSPTLGVTGLLDGDADTAVELNGTDEYVSAGGDASWMDSSTFTVEMWVAPDAINDRPIASRFNGGGSAASGEKCWLIDLRTSGSKIRAISTNTSNANFIAEGTAPATDGSATHVVMTCDGSNVRLYLDGSLADTSSAISGTLGNASGGIGLALGLRPDSPGSFSYYDGTVDEFAYYDTALSSTRIAAHYSAGTA